MVDKMVVRIRFGRGPKVRQQRRKNRHAAMVFASFLTPAAVMAAALGVWGLAAGPNWTSTFAIRNGIFSHWQVWGGFAVVLQTGSHFLNRYGRGEEPTAAATAGYPLAR
jgi:hypothetical protein